MEEGMENGEHSEKEANADIKQSKVSAFLARKYTYPIVWILFIVLFVTLIRVFLAISYLSGGICLIGIIIFGIIFFFIANPQDRERVRKRRAMLLIFLIIVLIGLNVLFRAHYEYHEERRFDTEEEKAALDAAEHLDYQAITGKTRYRGDEHTWVNYIDKEVIEDKRTEYTISSLELVYLGLEYHYEAESRFFGNLSVDISNKTISGDIMTGSFLFEGPLEYQNWRNHIDIYALNGTSLEPLNLSGEFTFEYSGVFLVSMRFENDYHSAPLAGAGNDIAQIVVLDVKHDPMFIIISSINWVS